MYEGKLVGLREFRREDLSLIHAWANDERLNRFLAFAIYPRTLDQTKAFLEAQLLRANDSYVNFVIYRLDDSEMTYLGSVGLKHIDRIHGHAELNVALGAVEHLGKGYGTEAVKLIVRYAFDRLNLHKVWLQLVDYNVAGRKAYENGGFQVDGVLRAHFRYANCYHDMLVMSLLRSNYYDRCHTAPPQ